MEVAETKTTLVALAPPIVTVGAARKPVPVIVIAVPPAELPLAGETLVIVGAAEACALGAIATEVPKMSPKITAAEVNRREENFKVFLILNGFLKASLAKLNFGESNFLKSLIGNFE